jgi:antitoxin (DNA-binding transcriptional repressor) of toxin-antitoxin stability system
MTIKANATKITKRGNPIACILPERDAGASVDWPKVDAFRATLRKSESGAAALHRGESSVATLRKRDRY